MAFLKFIKGAIVGNEEPKYEVVKKTDDYEVRKLPETQWLSLPLSGKSPDEFGRADFHRLFGYINGSNEAAASYDMTAPVMTRVSSDEEKKQEFTVSFFLPPRISDPPKPTDPDLYLEKLPAGEYYVRTFGGHAKDEIWKQEFETLKAKVENPSEMSLVRYFRAGYDPPFKPFNRRNEVWIMKNSSPQEIQND